MSRLPQDIEMHLRVAAPSGIEFTAEKDPHGVTVAWLALANRDELSGVGALLQSLGARLSMISANQPPAPEAEEEDDEESEEGAEPKEPPPPAMTFGGTPMDGTSYEIAYHFDIDGDMLTVIAHVPAGGSVPSLTPLFRAADWSERELMECYAVSVRSHPNPRRLFVDQSIDPAVLERLIPFSTLINAASTKGLWEKIMAVKAEAK